MPGRGEGRFEGGGGGKRFQIGVPLLFLVRVRILEREGGNIIAEGRWERVFSVVGEEGGRGVGGGLEIEENQWRCENGAVGYSVSVFFFFFFFFFLEHFVDVLFLIFFFFRSNYSQKSHSLNLQNFFPFGLRFI